MAAVMPLVAKVGADIAAFDRAMTVLERQRSGVKYGARECSYTRAPLATEQPFEAVTAMTSRQCTCGRLMSIKAKRCITCERVARGHVPRPCQGCGIQFIPNRNTGNAGKFHTRECALAWKSRLATQRRTARAEQRSREDKVVIARCHDCMAPTVSVWLSGLAKVARRKHFPRWCNECRPAALKRAQNDARRVLFPPLDRQCPVCLKKIRVRVGENGRPRLFCNDRCRAKASNSNGKRDARWFRKRGLEYEPVNWLKVCQRDRWRCQLCSVRTPRRLRGTYAPNAPEVDHVIPVSPPHRGGNTYANSQCLCRRCNATKRATVLGQLRLL